MHQCRRLWAGGDELLIRRLRPWQLSALPAVIAVVAGCLGPGSDEATPIEIAASRGDLATAEELLSAGADPNVRTFGNGPLGSAVGRSDSEMVRLLLLFDADPMEPDEFGGSYLIDVARKQRLSDDDVQPEDATIARMLVDAGADPCARSTEQELDGLRPSEIARQDGRQELADSLAALEQVCSD